MTQHHHARRRDCSVRSWKHPQPWLKRGQTETKGTLVSVGLFPHCEDCSADQRVSLAGCKNGMSASHASVLCPHLLYSCKTHPRSTPWNSDIVVVDDDD